ncbi:Metallo-dependent phosphatase-like protein [Dipodascopsis tothii]|uniref:Metallo-dependent phosphatase-like protein n=1 Tax=Dipodascopsis tothii TaxID=44089 RepID=UPI0034CF5F3F
MKLLTLLFSAGALVAGAAAGAVHVPGTKPDNVNEPLQFRLAYAGTTGMSVTWNTWSKVDRPTVYYGENVWDLSSTAEGSSTTFNASTTYNNHVKVTGLKPNTKYYYTVTNQNCYNCSETPAYSFTTAREPGDYTPYTIAVAIDLGLMGRDGLSAYTPDDALMPNETNTIQSLDRYIDGYDFIWQPGDIAYADYWLKEQVQKYRRWVPIEEGWTAYELLTNEFFEEMSPITARKPWMVGPGNHEANCDGSGVTDADTNQTWTYDICAPGQRNFTNYRHRFNMPAEESGGVENFWYSWDHGMVHYIELNTETDIGDGFIGPDEPNGTYKLDSGPFGSYANQQVDWLRDDLAKVNRTKTPWIIVSGHRPFYASFDNNPNSICDECREVFEPLFIEYNVDLVFAGHIHMYNRNDPMNNNVSDPNGLNNPSSPWYILNGAAGHYDGLDVAQYPLRPYTRKNIDGVYGWSRVTIHNCTHMTHDFIASGNGSVLDTATLYKNHTCGIAATATSNSSSNYTGSTALPTTNAGGRLGQGAVVVAVVAAAVGSLMM